jgi:hypothetical protein
MEICQQNGLIWTQWLNKKYDIWLKWHTHYNLIYHNYEFIGTQSIYVCTTFQICYDFKYCKITLIFCVCFGVILICLSFDIAVKYYINCIVLHRAGFFLNQNKWKQIIKVKNNYVGDTLWHSLILLQHFQTLYEVWKELTLGPIKL